MKAFKGTLTFVIALCLLSAAFAKGDTGWYTDFEKAMAAAKKSGKVVMVDFNATWCGPCQLYKKDVFPTAAFKKATSDVILVTIDTDRQPALARKYAVTGIPDIRFFNAKGKEVGKVVGYGGAERLLDEIKKAKKAAKP